MILRFFWAFSRSLVIVLCLGSLSCKARIPSDNGLSEVKVNVTVAYWSAALPDGGNGLCRGECDVASDSKSDLDSQTDCRKNLKFIESSALENDQELSALIPRLNPADKIGIDPFLDSKTEEGRATIRRFEKIFGSK